MNSEIDTDFLRTWIGKSQTETDTITAAPMRMMRATMDMPEASSGMALQAADALPPLWHWLYFLPSPLQSELGEDGHAKRGGFLPPVPLPRRMWAAGQFEFFHDLKLGDEITRTSTIDDVTVKHGRTGSLCFVKVKHEVSNQNGLALREFHDIVYRPQPASPTSHAGLQATSSMASQPSYEVAPKAALSEQIVPSDPLLFRYSALTFNGHRIHYDRKYVTEVEGYPGLIVHGPLMATLLAGLGKKVNPDASIASFEFRALKPVFDLHPFEICAGELSDNTLSLWVSDFEGHATMKATMKFVA